MQFQWHDDVLALVCYGASNASGMKFYQGGIVYHAPTDQFIVVFNWGQGGPDELFSAGQTRVGGVFGSVSAARSVLNRKMTAKMNRDYVSWGGPTAKAGHYLQQWVSSVVANKLDMSGGDATQAAVAFGGSVAKLLGAKVPEAAWMQYAVEIRAHLGEQKAKLLAEMDQVDAEIELLDMSISHRMTA